MQVILYMAITANGLIAREDDSVDWLSPQSWASYKKILQDTGCAVIGRRTYELMSLEEFVKDCLYVVLTSKPFKSQNPNIIFTHQSPREILRFLEDKGLHTVCVAGGGRVNSAFIKAGLIDELYLDVEPIILGQGISLFWPDNFEFNLQLVGVDKLNNTLRLHYKVKK